MNAETFTHPDPDRLRDLLDEQLTPETRRSVERHLEVCDPCRRELERLAAPSHWWRWSEKVVAHESRRGNDDRLRSPEASETSRGTETVHRDTADEIVQRLHPSDWEGGLGRIATFEVSGVVGSGATAIVLKGRDPALGRTIAIKVLRPHLAAEPIARERFAREARAIAAIVHPGVIEVYRVDRHDDLPYFVMPYVGGQSLAQRMKREGRLPPLEALRVASQVSEALKAAHACGVIHRDVKPSNVLLGEKTERAVLTDFGLAIADTEVSLTRTGMVAGTPEYMSPEQARGETLDHRSDLFSLGAMLYAMLTGRPPFRGDNCYHLLRQITDKPHTSIRHHDPSLPVWLERLVDRLLEKSPENRPESTEQVATWLRAAAAHCRDVKLPPPDCPSSVTEATGSASANPPMGRDQMIGTDDRTTKRSTLLKRWGALILVPSFAGLLIWLAGIGLSFLGGADQPQVRPAKPSAGVFDPVPEDVGMSDPVAAEDGMPATLTMPDPPKPGNDLPNDRFRWDDDVSDWLEEVAAGLDAID